MSPREKPGKPRRPSRPAAPHNPHGKSRPPCSMCGQPFPHHTGQCPVVS